MLPQDLIPLLKSWGLSVPDEERAISYLTNIGYFRLSAYLYPLLKDPKTDHIYKNGVTFDMDEFYHYDTPCTINNQISMLKKAGFKNVNEIWRKEATTIIIAKKSINFDKIKKQVKK
jgi:hypothetical protein